MRMTRSAWRRPSARQVQPVLVVAHQVEAFEPLDEPCGVAARDAERPGQALERRRPLAVLTVPQVLEGVLDLDAVGGDEPSLPAPGEARARPEDDDGQRQHAETATRETSGSIMASLPGQGTVLELYATAKQYFRLD